MVGDPSFASMQGHGQDDTNIRRVSSQLKLGSLSANCGNGMPVLDEAPELYRLGVRKAFVCFGGVWSVCVYVWPKSHMDLEWDKT